MTSPHAVIDEEASLLALEHGRLVREQAQTDATPLDGREGEGSYLQSEPRPIYQAIFQRGDHVELACFMLDALRQNGEVVFADGALYQYNAAAGLFVAVDEQSKSNILQSCAGATVKSQGRGKPKPLRVRATDVRGSIELAHHQVTQTDFFAKAPAGLAFTNGFLHVDAEGAVLLPHSRDHRARSAFPFALEQESPRARFTAFLEDLFRDDGDGNEKVLLLQEFLGACLLGRATLYQVALVLLGDGANGKSTLLTIVREAMPTGTVCAIPPQDWNQEYRRALIAGKRLNMVSELPEADIIASESFKAIVTGDAILGRPIREAPFTFVPISGHLFAANRLPGANDMTDGFWRRFLVLRFNRTFRGESANPHLAAEVIKHERQGVVRWMLEGAARVARQQRYTTPASAIGERKEWERQANPVALFLDECTRDTTAASPGTSATSLYVQFRAWCEQNGHRAMSSTKFGMRMRELGRGPEKKRDGNCYPVTLTYGVRP